MVQIPTSATDWKIVHKLGSSASCILLVYSLVTMVLLLTIGGQPTNAQDCFAMLQKSRLVGLLRLDVLTILALPLYYLVTLSLFLALQKTKGALVLLAGTLAFAGITLVLATPSAFSWLALSDKFDIAATEADRSRLLAAGEAILASDIWHGSGAFVGGMLNQTGMVLISILMLRGDLFRKVTAWLGVVTHGLDLAHILVAVPYPAGAVVLMATAGPLYLLWFPFLAADQFRLSRR